VCILLQTLGQSFMANAAAAQGLSAALAPPASAGRPGMTATVRGGGGGGGGGAGGSGPARDSTSQHTVSVSLGKAWLEILVKLMRRASASSGASGGG
ncbi:unnamed protein product, partial [Laminaria digitata]